MGSDYQMGRRFLFYRGLNMIYHFIWAATPFYRSGVGKPLKQRLYNTKKEIKPGGTGCNNRDSLFGDLFMSLYRSIWNEADAGSFDGMKWRWMLRCLSFMIPASNHGVDLNKPRIFRFSFL
jgi:hypothetical protein